MNAVQFRLAAAALFFVLVFLSGYWLSGSGRPYPGILFTVHKLTALGGLIYLGITVYEIQQLSPLEPLSWAAIAFTLVFALAAIITGGLLSAGGSLTALAHRVHQAAPYLTVLSTAALLYLLPGS